MLLQNIYKNFRKSFTKGLALVLEQEIKQKQIILSWSLFIYFFETLPFAVTVNQILMFIFFRSNHKTKI
jgi:hypothetical protein